MPLDTALGPFPWKTGFPRGPPRRAYITLAQRHGLLFLGPLIAAPVLRENGLYSILGRWGV